MKYMLLIHSQEAGWAAMSEEQKREGMAAYTAYSEAIEKSGVLVDSHRLQPASVSTTVRVQNGKTSVLNGPYAETKEQLGGYFMIDVPDLDAAITWAARCPGASHGAVEIRPVWPM